MSKMKNADVTAAVSPAPIGAGSPVLYTDPEALTVVHATVVEAHDEVVDLAYRDGSGALRTAEHIAHGPGLVGRWSRPGEEPAPPPPPPPPPPRGVPMAGGRPVVVGAVVTYHACRCDDEREYFRLVTGRVIKVLEGGEFVAEFPGLGAVRHRLRVDRYSGDRFLQDYWSWGGDGVSAPPPRRYSSLQRDIRCPLTGLWVPRCQALRVLVGPPASLEEVTRADALLSPEGAGQLLALLRGSRAIGS